MYRPRVCPFYGALWGGGCLLASVVFGYFSTNAAGAAYITLPASAFEKWLCGVLITGVFYTGIFLVFYRLMDTAFITAYHNGLDKNNPAYRAMYDDVYINRYDSFMVRQSFTFFLNLAGAMLLGSLYFNRVAIVKTGITVVVTVAGIYFLNLGLAHLFFNSVDGAVPFSGVFIRTGNELGRIEMPYKYLRMALISFQYIIPAILWYTAYIRLKGKQI